MSVVKLKKPDYILTDIEGTTSDISFVKDVLFPYSAREMRNYVSTHRHSPQVIDVLKQTEKPDENAAIEQLLEWIKKDVKHPALKTIQGLIWKKAFENKVFLSHVYPDVKECLESWRNQNIHIAVYSSGSVDAQKLFFKHTEAGDLLPHFAHHFDLAVGKKAEAISYIKISEALKTKNILFLSDIESELEAAKSAGLNAIQLVRPGTQPSAKNIKVAHFKEIQFT